MTWVTFFCHVANKTYSCSSKFAVIMSSDNFDFFEHLLLHGLEHIIEEILLLLPLEDVLCSVNLVCR